MGVFHQSFVLDLATLGKKLQDVVRAQEVSDDLVEKTCKEIIAKSNASAKEFFTLICFDEEWLEPPISPNEQFVVALGSSLGKTQSLSNLSFASIERTFPAFGWDLENVRLLLAGRSLYTLARLLSLPPLYEEYLKGIYNVSWLSLADINMLNDQVDAVKNSLFSPKKETIEEIKKVLNGFRGKNPPEDVLKNLYSEIKQRLFTASNEASPLLLFNDATSYIGNHSKMRLVDEPI